MNQPPGQTLTTGIRAGQRQGEPIVLQVLLELATALYVLAAGLLAFFVGSFGVLIALYLRTRHDEVPPPAVNDDTCPPSRCSCRSTTKRTSSPV